MDRALPLPSHPALPFRWPAVAAAWLLVGAFRYSQVYLDAMIGMSPLSWEAVRWPLAVGLLLRTAVWILYTPVVLHLARRHPLGPGAWLRPLGVHAAAALALAAAAIPLYYLLSYALYPQTLRFGLAPYFFQNLGSELVLYAAVAGIAHAVEHHRRAREREAGAARLEAEVRDAQLDAMRFRLDTDLVDGALGTLTRLVRRSPDEAEDLIAGLGDLVRGRLAAAHEPAAVLGEELEAAETYLDVRRAVAGRPLELEVDAPPRLLGEPVPSGAVQALLEHALGPAGRPDARRLRLAVRREGGDLVMEVRADGGRAGSASPADDAESWQEPHRVTPIEGGFRLTLPPPVPA